MIFCHPFFDRDNMQLAMGRAMIEYTSTTNTEQLYPINLQLLAAQ